MVRDLRIEVTQEDIDGALRQNSYHCVVANAIVRQVPNARKVIVDVQSIRFSDKVANKRYVFLTPPSIQQYITDFDAGDTIMPFRFELRKPIWIGPVGGGTAKGSSYLNVSEQKKTHNAGKTLSIADSRPPALRGWTARRVYGRRVLRQNRDRDA